MLPNISLSPDDPAFLAASSLAVLKSRSPRKLAKPPTGPVSMLLVS